MWPAIISSQLSSQLYDQELAESIVNSIIRPQRFSSLVSSQQWHKMAQHGQQYGKYMKWFDQVGYLHDTYSE